ncbi:LuxR C-terminal-related transcriptional regulator [Neobacillus niacini]|uniref:helix-turn-helix domain-containing protein n=1 Tax=Neobacillus niacini TaxID=86668 RepID=UPI0021CB44ED|nr:LuxR C-terminal-related transcriptional regulator [Neobacillus niacini]MCM3768369.1 LuxR C-terminal-related transcriptional regulator [Neobacillus niacini]
MKENEYTHKPLLTKREREVFELLVQDKTTKEIAGELFISEKTVRNHISNAMHSVCKPR